MILAAFTLYFTTFLNTFLYSLLHYICKEYSGYTLHFACDLVFSSAVTLTHPNLSSRLLYVKASSLAIGWVGHVCHLYGTGLGQGFYIA